MAKTMNISGKVVSFRMSLKGGKLPENFEIELPVTLNFTGATDEQMMICCAGGSSARVKLQAQLREKSVADLRKLSIDGVKVKFTDIISGTGVQKSYPDIIRAMGEEAGVKQLMADIQIDEKTAKTYFKKITTE